MRFSLYFFIAIFLATAVYAQCGFVDGSAPAFSNLSAPQNFSVSSPCEGGVPNVSVACGLSLPVTLTLQCNGTECGTVTSDTGSSICTNSTAVVVSSFARIWVNRYNVTSPNETAAAILFDSGFVYVAHTSSNGSNDTDIVVRKKNATDGSDVWKRRFNSNASDAAIDLVLYPNSDIAVVGRTNRFPIISSFAWDVFAWRLTPSGSTVFITAIELQGAPGTNLNDFPTGGLIDSSSNLIIFGFSDTLALAQNAFIIAFNGSGTPVGGLFYDLLGLNDEWLSGALDGSDNVYVTGFGNVLVANPDIVTLKTGPAPSLSATWASRQDGGINSSDQGNDIIVESSNIIVAGKATQSGPDENAFLMRYLTNGSSVWKQTINNSGRSDSFVSISSFSAAEFVATGDSISGGAGDIITFQGFRSNGSSTGGSIYAGTGDDRVTAGIAVNSPDSIFVSGKAGGRMLTIKYFDGLGFPAFVALGDSGVLDFKAEDLDADSSDTVYVTGDGDDLVWTVAYQEVELAIPEFSIFALVLALLVAIVGIVMVRAHR